MRILHVTHQYPPEFVGGVEVYTQSLAQLQRSAGHDVAVFTRGATGTDDKRSEQAEDTLIFTTSGDGLGATERFLSTFGYSKQDARIVAHFAEFLDTFEPDIIHVQHMMGLPIRCFELIRERGIPFVVTLWDFWWVCANAQLLTNYSDKVCDGPNAYLNCTRCAITRSKQGANPDASSWYLRKKQLALWAAAPMLTGVLAYRGRLLRSALLHADCLIAPTNFVYQWHRKRDIVAKEIRVIKPGLEGFSIPEKPRDERPIRFFYLGGITPQKGVHVALEAFTQLTGKAELWIAGDRTVDAAYSTQLEQVANSSVKFLGRLSRAEVADALVQVDVFLAPSIWYETFCFVLHEAFSAGVPVIGSNLGAIAEGVDHGVDGLLAEPDDVESWRGAMQSLLDDHALLAQLRAGIRRPQTQREHAEQIQILYCELSGSLFEGGRSG